MFGDSELDECSSGDGDDDCRCTASYSADEDEESFCLACYSGIDFDDVHDLEQH